MNTIKNLLAGLGGAAALNFLHESLKHSGSDMPRIDLLGEEALQKGLNYAATEIESKDNLYAATLGADVMSNAVYYSAIGVGSPKYVWHRAVALGLSAGLGAITLPEKMGLDPEPVTKSQKTKALTIAYYLAGALVTAGIISAQNRDV